MRATIKDRSMKDEAEQTFWHDENLPYIEARSACNSYACYEKHTHPTLSIGVVEEGISKYHHQRFSKTIGSGSIVIINPEEVHSCNPKPNEHWAYKMFNIDPCWLAELQGEMTEGVEKYAPFSVVHSDDKFLYESIRSLYHFLLARNEVIEKEIRLIQFFSTFLHRFGGAEFKISDSNGNKKLQLARDYIADNCTSKLSIDQISKASDLSGYYLIRAFKRKYGLTPHAFQLDQRVNLSKMMLKSGMNLAETAFAAGFSDHSHFHLCFKKRVAATPRQYQEQVSGKAY
ncbi:MAG: AraC family transcriptional regulator [Sedimenticola selenatireducens]|uniref:AraC family transcriptional regulator n=2 Tax=Sedimenticola selenatireducens TaxID=191960 RepID=A0A2N6CW00_9GAMM|nr:MAG: AraC family transcriptional regulator [Sedimenticola selenatireducens]